MRTRDERRWRRAVKAWRRIKEDQAQHGQARICECFIPTGRTFALYADTPTRCSCWMCGNPRRYFGNGHLSLSRREQSALVDDVEQRGHALPGM